jgi:hypothetical protein
MRVALTELAGELREGLLALAGGTGLQYDFTPASQSVISPINRNRLVPSTACR